MLFFLLSLALCLAVTVALLLVLLKSLKINWERKNRRPIGYLSPVLLTVLFLGLTIFMTAPRILDTISLIAGTYEIGEITVEADDIGWNSLKVGNRRYTRDPWQGKIEPGKTYRITYTPLSRFIIDITDIGETAATPE